MPNDGRDNARGHEEQQPGSEHPSKNNPVISSHLPHSLPLSPVGPASRAGQQPPWPSPSELGSRGLPGGRGELLSRGAALQDLFNLLDRSMPSHQANLAVDHQGRSEQTSMAMMRPISVTCSTVATMPSAAGPFPRRLSVAGIPGSRGLILGSMACASFARGYIFSVSVPQRVAIDIWSLSCREPA